MDFERIDLAGLKPGWGSVYQGGAADQAVEQLPGPLLITVMDRGEQNEQFIDHQNVQAVLAVWIDDSPTACLPDNVLLLLAQTEIAWLKAGGNIYDHCAAGISRASYNDCAIHMAALGIGFDEALALIRTQRPQANPNSGFVDQLRRLEPQLKGLSVT